MSDLESNQGLWVVGAAMAGSAEAADLKVPEGYERINVRRKSLVAEFDADGNLMPARDLGEATLIIRTEAGSAAVQGAAELEID
jgi:hypothetical protein